MFLIPRGLQQSQGDGRYDGQTDHSIAALVEISNLESHAHVPGKMSETVEKMEGDGESQTELGQSD